MSQENVELVRRALGMFNDYSKAHARDDQDALDELFEATTGLLVADFEYREDPMWPGAQTYRGLPECRRVWDAYYETLGELALEPEKFFDAGDQIAVFIRFWARGTASGAEAEMRQAQVFTLRGSRISKWEVYFDRDDALKAVGLSESSGQA